MSLSEDLNGIAYAVDKLEEENGRLQKLADTLAEELEATKMKLQEAEVSIHIAGGWALENDNLKEYRDKVETFLDLVRPDIDLKERCILNDERLVKLIEAYRNIRPKEAVEC